MNYNPKTESILNNYFCELLLFNNTFPIQSQKKNITRMALSYMHYLSIKIQYLRIAP